MLKYNYIAAVTVMMIMMIMSMAIIMTELGGTGDRTNNEACVRNITLL